MFKKLRRSKANAENISPNNPQELVKSSQSKATLAKKCDVLVAKIENRTNNDYKSLSFEINIEISEHYDKIKNAIDIKAQEIFSLIDKEQFDICRKCKDNKENKQYDKYRSELLKLNEQNIKYLSELCEHNIEQVNSYFETSDQKSTDKDHIKTKAFKSHCVYIERNEMCKYFKLKYPLGIIVSSDWFLSKKESDFLRMQFRYKEKGFIDPNYNKGVFELDNRLVNLTTSFYKLKDKENFKGKLPIEQTQENIFHLSSQCFEEYCLTQKDLIIETEGLVVNHLISRIKENTFLNFKNLECLEMNRNFWNCPARKKCEMDADALAGLANLKVLKMFHMDVSLSLNFAHLVNLRELHLIKFNKKLKKFVALSPKQFAGIQQSLKVLNLNDSIFKLEENFFKQMSQLESLSLNDSLIRRVPYGLFKGLENLAHLNILHIGIESDFVREDLIKDMLAELKNLKKLEITWDDFIELKTKACELMMNKLEEINLNFWNEDDDEDDDYVTNELTKHAKLIAQLTSIKKLTISFYEEHSGGLEITDKLFKPFAHVAQSIESLEMNGFTNGCKIKGNSFKIFKNLKSLKLNEIGIEELNKNTFNGLACLELLDLSHNPMRALPEYTFSKLVNLTTLNITNNELREISPKAFQGCKKISSINMKKSLMGSLVSRHEEVCKRHLGVNDSVQILYDEDKDDDDDDKESEDHLDDIPPKIQEHLLEGHVDEEKKGNKLAFRILQLHGKIDDPRFKDNSLSFWGFDESFYYDDQYMKNSSSDAEYE